MNNDFLNLQDSVKYVERKILNGNRGFFVLTEFGKIGIEIVSSEYDPLYPVEVCSWIEAPASPWAFKNRGVKADTYVSIGESVDGSRLSIHMRSIEAVCRSFIIHHTDISNLTRDMIDVIIKMYCMCYDGKEPSLNKLESEFCRVNLSPFTRGDIMVKEIARELLRRRCEEVTRIMNESQKLMKESGYDLLTSYSDDFHKGLCGILMYAKKKVLERELVSKGIRTYGVEFKAEYYGLMR